MKDFPRVIGVSRFDVTSNLNLVSQEKDNNNSLENILGFQLVCNTFNLNDYIDVHEIMAFLKTLAELVLMIERKWFIYDNKMRGYSNETKIIYAMMQ